MDDPGEYAGLIPHRLFPTLVQLVRSKGTSDLDVLLKAKSSEVGEIKEMFHRKLERVKVRILSDDNAARTLFSSLRFKRVAEFC
jgi:hypothetical protein